MSRFEYVGFDDKAKKDQKHVRELCEALESKIQLIGRSLDPHVDKAFCQRSKDEALAKLEEVYMWVGKAVRDEQVARNLTKPPLPEEKQNA